MKRGTMRLGVVAWRHGRLEWPESALGPLGRSTNFHFMDSNPLFTRSGFKLTCFESHAVAA